LFLLKRSGGSTPPPGTTDAPLSSYFKWSGILLAIVATIGVVAAQVLHWMGWD
jgi:hypothetical protein